MMLGASVVTRYDKLCSQKFLLINSSDVIRRSNQLMYSLCLPIRYYDSSDIEFGMVMNK